eukprot:UN05443
MYESFMKVAPIDCQKMVSLETRIKVLIKSHVALKKQHAETCDELTNEKKNMLIHNKL